MKTRVRTIHGKVLVQGGINPENELKPHEILLDEKADGTVELKERNINGEVVSIAGGGSSSDGISIPFYYTEITDSWTSDYKVLQGEISLNSEIPNVNADREQLWYTYRLNSIEYLSAFSYYTKENENNAAYPISKELSVEIEESIYNDAEILENVEKAVKEYLATYKKDLNIMFYYDTSYDEGKTYLSIGISSDMSAFMCTLSNDEESLSTKYLQTYLYHYDYISGILTEICPVSKILGTVLLMKPESTQEN